MGVQRPAHPACEARCGHLFSPSHSRKANGPGGNLYTTEVSPHRQSGPCPLPRGQVAAFCQHTSPHGPLCRSVLGIGSLGEGLLSLLLAFQSLSWLPWGREREVSLGFSAPSPSQASLPCCRAARPLGFWVSLWNQALNVPSGRLAPRKCSFSDIYALNRRPDTPVSSRHH